MLLVAVDAAGKAPCRQQELLIHAACCLESQCRNRYTQGAACVANSLLAHLPTVMR
jgi:hypothetical protein